MNTNLKTTTMNEYRPYWYEFRDHVQELARKLSAANVLPLDALACITRGGLSVGAILAHELNVQMISTICVFSYENQHRGEVCLLKAPHLFGRVLIVDDLVDSGATMRLVRERWPRAFTAVVYAKPEGQKDVHLFVKEVPQDTWIVFPWEV